MHIKVKLLLHRLISRVQRQTKNTTPTHGSLQNTFLCVVLLMSHYIYILFLQGPNTCRNSYCEFVFLLLINCQYFSTSSSTMFRKRDKLSGINDIRCRVLIATVNVGCCLRRRTYTESHTHHGCACSSHTRKKHRSRQTCSRVESRDNITIHDHAGNMVPVVDTISRTTCNFKINESLMLESALILSAFKNRLRADQFNTPCKQIQPLSRIKH